MPLTGLRVLDLTRVVSGPFCTMMLADFGAEVIKVEAPDGDPSRYTGIVADVGENPYFVNLNRNKRAITINMKTDAGREIVRRLARRADVVVENFRPGVMDRLGLGYEQLSKENPGIVYASISGFGLTGPYRDRPAFDFIAQAVSGFMSLNGAEDQDPMRAGIPISDTVAGLYTAFGILAALRDRDRTGKGQMVTCAMVDGLISMYAFAVAAYFSTGELPPRNGNDHMVVAPYGLFHASDGLLAVAPSTDKTWLSLCQALEREDLPADPRFATPALRRENRKAINEIVDGIIGQQPIAHWIDILNKAGVPCGPVNNLHQVFKDPQVLHQEMAIESPQPSGPVKVPGFPVKMTGTPACIRRPSPQEGEHTEEVLAELGYEPEEIAKMLADGAVECYSHRSPERRLTEPAN